MDLIDRLVQVTNNSRNKKIRENVKEISEYVAPKIETKIVSITETGGPFAHTYEKEVPCDAAKVAADKVKSEWENTLAELKKDAENVADTYSVLKAAGIENPRIISSRDIEAIKSMEIVHVDEDPDVENGKLHYTMPNMEKLYKGYRGFNKGFRYKIRAAVKLSQNNTKTIDFLLDLKKQVIVDIDNKNLIIKNIFKFLIESGKNHIYIFRTEFKLPPAPKYMVEAQKLFSQIVTESITETITYEKKFIGRKFFKKIYEENEVILKSTPRFKIGYIIDYSLLNSQLEGIYKNNPKAIIPDLDPIIFLKDLKNNTYHIGPHYGGDALIGEKKVLEMIEEMYISM